MIEKVATAVLSTTAKVKARQRKNDKEKGKDVPVDMEIVKLIGFFEVYFVF